MRLVLALALGSLLCAVPAKADSIAGAGIQVVFDNPSNPSLFESFQSTLQFDRTTESIVPGSVQTSSFGALGPFSFSSFVSEIGHNQFGEILSDVFTWDDTIGDDLSILVDDFGHSTDGNFPLHWVDAAFLTGPNVAGWSELAPPERIGDFLILDNPSDPPSDPPAPTPEPSTLIMLGVGLIGLVLMSRKLIVSG